MPRYAIPGRETGISSAAYPQVALELMAKASKDSECEVTWPSEDYFADLEA